MQVMEATVVILELFGAAADQMSYIESFGNNKMKSSQAILNACVKLLQIRVKPCENTVISNIFHEYVCNIYLNLESPFL